MDGRPMSIERDIWNLSVWLLLLPWVLSALGTRVATIFLSLKVFCIARIGFGG